MSARCQNATAETGAALVDLEKDFAGQPDPRVFFTDGIHLSPIGNKRAASALALALARLGI